MHSKKEAVCGTILHRPGVEEYELTARHVALEILYKHWDDEAQCKLCKEILHFNTDMVTQIYLFF